MEGVKYHTSFSPKRLEGYDLQPSPFYIGGKDTYPPEIANIKIHNLPKSKEVVPAEIEKDPSEEKKEQPKEETIVQTEPKEEVAEIKVFSPLAKTKKLSFYNAKELYVNNTYDGHIDGYFPVPSANNNPAELAKFISYPSSTPLNPTMMQGQPMMVGQTMMPGQQIMPGHQPVLQGQQIMPGQQIMQGQQPMMQGQPMMTAQQMMIPGQQQMMMPGQQMMMSGHQSMMMPGQQSMMIPGQQSMMMPGQQQMMMPGQPMMQGQPMMMPAQQMMMHGQSIAFPPQSSGSFPKIV